MTTKWRVVEHSPGTIIVQRSGLRRNWLGRKKEVWFTIPSLLWNPYVQTPMTFPTIDHAMAFVEREKARDAVSDGFAPRVVEVA